MFMVEFVHVYPENSSFDFGYMNAVRVLARPSPSAQYPFASLLECHTRSIKIDISVEDMIAGRSGT